MKTAGIDYGDDTYHEYRVFCTTAHDPLAAQIIMTQLAMIRIEEDVDLMDLEEEEEAMMREAELEHLQMEAEIALNTRWNGDQLQPYFGDDAQMLSEIPPGANLNGTLDGATVEEQNESYNEITETPFSVMTRALWATLRQHMTNGESLQQVDDPASGLSWILYVNTLQVHV